MAKAIEVENLTKYYGDLLAVDHISFEVEQGEIFGFLGPNGAGKTTTQRMLTTLLEPTEGRIVIFGYDLAHNPYPVKRQMGLVPEGMPWREIVRAARELDVELIVVGAHGKRGLTGRLLGMAAVGECVGPVKQLHKPAKASGLEECMIW